ncbi:MAG: hypothetical protein KAV87_35165 [Desulfobacteraceae bacterium]|nr:hypothetical protein [Desulfobacteraceae bacterium]
MSDEKSSGLNWVRIVQIVGLVLFLWAAITLISGLAFADVDPDPGFGRSFPFEDTGITGYGTYAWLGGAIGLVLMAITYYLDKKE